MDHHAARNGQASIPTPNFITPNSSASSSTGIIPSIPDASFAASSSLYTPQGTVPQYGLEFGTAAERERASRPKINLSNQKQRVQAVKASRRQAQHQSQFQVEVPADQPHPQPQYGPGPQQHSQFQYGPGPQPQLQPQAQPPHLLVHPSHMYQFPNPNVAPGLVPNANYGMANARFGAGWSQYGAPGMQGIARTMGPPPPPPPPSYYFPQGQMGRWPSGHVIPASHHYGGYTPGPQAMGEPSYTSPVLTVPEPAMGVNHQAMVLSPQEQEQATAAPAPAPATSWMQWNMPQRPEDINCWLASISPPPPSPSGEPYYGEQLHQGPMLPAAPVAADEGSLMQGRKRRASDDDDTRQTKRYRFSAADDPDFELEVQADGEKKWRCTKPACSNTKALKEVSVDQHRLTATHRQGSSEPQPVFTCPQCGENFLRMDSLKRHGPTERCSTNKKFLQAHQNTMVPVPPLTAQGPSPEAASSSATQQSQPSPMFHQEVPYLPAVQSSVQTPSVLRSMERQPSGAAPSPFIAATDFHIFPSISPPLPEPHSVQQQLFGSPSSYVMAEDREDLFMPPTSLPLSLPIAHATDAPVPDENAATPPIFSFDYAVLDTDFEDWCSNADSTY